MFGLPANSIVGKPLPKTAIYAKFGASATERERFDADVSRIAIANVIDARHMTAGANVKSIYVLAVQLKHKDYAPKNIVALAKLIEQNIIFALMFGDEVQLAVYCTRLVVSAWLPADDVVIPLDGLNLDGVWEHMVATIGGIAIDEGNTVAEQIVADDARTRLMRQIAQLEARCRAERQPRRKLELFEKLKELKKKL